MTAIQFLTRTGQTCTPIRQEFILLSDVLGVSAVVDALNNPPINGAMESSVLGPFFTEDAPDGMLHILRSVLALTAGQWVLETRSHQKAKATTCMSKGVCYLPTVPRSPMPSLKLGKQMASVCRVPHRPVSQLKPVLGNYDTQYAVRDKPDCRGRLRSGPDGKYGYRAVVPVPYPIPGDVSETMEFIAQRR
jgi:hypothetical protein